MSRWYWYQHIDPTTKEVVYVGHGSGGRAWQCGSSHSPLRSKEHCKWADELLDRGVTPDEWVEIGDRGISKDEAKAIELQLIHRLKPRFNKNFESKSLKFTREHLRLAQHLRSADYSYQRIADEMGFSAMTVHRALTGGTIAHQR